MLQNFSELYVGFTHACRSAHLGFKLKCSLHKSTRTYKNKSVDALLYSIHHLDRYLASQGWRKLSSHLISSTFSECLDHQLIALLAEGNCRQALMANIWDRMAVCRFEMSTSTQRGVYEMIGPFPLNVHHRTSQIINKYIALAIT